jgi:integrase
MYGDEPATAFSPSKLRAIRARWVEDGICRHQVNLRVGRLKRVFKWGVSEELVPVAVWQALCTVQGLQAHRTEAVESKRIEPVPDERVTATLAFLRPQVRDMVEVQRLTGMRPGEVCQLRLREIDRTGQVWEYRPARHKTAWRGKERVVFIGPRVQAILSRYANADPDAYLFSPREAVDQLHRERGENRVTTYYASRQGWQQRTAHPKRRPGERYTVTAYGQAIRRACARAFRLPDYLRRRRVKLNDGHRRWETAGEWRARVGPAGVAEAATWRDRHTWHPNQLRHAAGMDVRKAYGIEAAQVILGHSRANVTEVYAERDLDRARRIKAEIG